MIKTRSIKEKDLPLEYAGEEKSTSRSVYELRGSLNSDIVLALKAHGYVNDKAELKSGDVIASAWIKMA